MRVHPDAPAFPIPEDESSTRQNGLPIRLELAARFMAALMSNNGVKSSVTNVDLANISLTFADALIQEFNKGA